MDNRGKQAMRSGAVSLPPEELNDLPEEQLAIDNEQEQANAKYASLKGHPGWELIKQDFEKTINSYRSGGFAKAAIDKGITDAELGALTRTGNALADELEHKILTVEGAAMAVEEAKHGRTK